MTNFEYLLLSGGGLYTLSGDVYPNLLDPHAGPIYSVNLEWLPYANTRVIEKWIMKNTMTSLDREWMNPKYTTEYCKHIRYEWDLSQESKCTCQQDDDSCEEWVDSEVHSCDEVVVRNIDSDNGWEYDERWIKVSNSRPINL